MPSTLPLHTLAICALRAQPRMRAKMQIFEAIIVIYQ